MPKSHCADVKSQLAMMGEILAYSWASIDHILMVPDVNFMIPTDPDTVMASPRIVEKCSTIVT